MLGAMPTQHVMTRRRFLDLTDDLIGEGEAILADPDWNRFRLWLLNSDELLEKVWGRMDRYHLAWLNVGRDIAGRRGHPALRHRGRGREAGRAAYDEDRGRAARLDPAQRG
jgi:hypothetical protein